MGYNFLIIIIVIVVLHTCNTTMHTVAYMHTVTRFSKNVKKLGVHH